MSELVADLFVSLDACACACARASAVGGRRSAVGGGPYFGYGGPELERWIQAELDKPQVIVLGRVIYEALASVSHRVRSGVREAHDVTARRR